MLKLIFNGRPAKFCQRNFFQFDFGEKFLAKNCKFTQKQDRTKKMNIVIFISFEFFLIEWNL